MNRPLKISIATGPNYPVPPIRGGAVQRIWNGIAKALARAGHEVTCLSCADPDLPEKEVADGVTYLRHGGFSQSLSIKKDLMKDLFYALGLAGNLPDADILVCNDFWLPVAARWRSQHAGKIVVSAERFPKKQYALYSGAAMVRAVSQVVADKIAEQTPAMASRVKVVPNPVDDQFFSPVARTPATACPRLLYVGRVHPEKGLNLLIDAFRTVHQRHPGATLNIVGPSAINSGGGGPAYLEELKALCGGLPVSFSGPTFDTGALLHAYREADLFCYPSVAETGESFGLAPLEAMATALVPVVSALECFGDFIQDGVTGHVFDHRNGNPAENLAAKLLLALDSPDRLADMGRQCSELAKTYSYENISAELLKHFQRIINDG